MGLLPSKNELPMVQRRREDNKNKISLFEGEGGRGGREANPKSSKTLFLRETPRQ